MICIIYCSSYLSFIIYFLLHCVVATRDIQPDEEFLLDYGEAYTKAFLLPKPKCPDSNISVGVMESELPGGLVEEDERETKTEIEIEVEKGTRKEVEIETEVGREIETEIVVEVNNLKLEV